MYLYLCTVPGCDIGDGPTCLFFNGFFWATQQVKETLQGRAVKNHLFMRKQIMLHSKHVMATTLLQRTNKYSGFTWVCRSSPVTMFPTALRAGDTTLYSACLENMKTTAQKTAVILRIWSSTHKNTKERSHLKSLSQWFSTWGGLGRLGGLSKIPKGNKMA